MVNLVDLLSLSVIFHDVEGIKKVKNKTEVSKVTIHHSNSDFS